MGDIDLLGGLPGLRDFFPEDWNEIIYILRKMREVSLSYGYQEYEGPSIEPVELIEAKSGEGLMREIFQLRDRNDRRLLLRPEQTPTLARMLATQQQRYKRPMRWFSIPRLFRDETVQKGRVREFWQLNVDMLGENSLIADAETIAVAIDIIRGCGLPDEEFNVFVNHRDLLNSFIAELTEIESGKLITLIDKKMGLLQDHFRFELENRGLNAQDAEKTSLLLRRIVNSKGSFRTKLIDSLDEENHDLIDNSDQYIRDVLSNEFLKLGMDESRAQKLTAFTEINGTINDVMAALEGYNLSESAMSAAQDLEKLATYLEGYGVLTPVVFDLSMARGLDYYTGVVYEAFDSTGEIVRAIFGGGRYADLVEVMGGSPLSGVGFGMGETVLMELMKLRNAFPEKITPSPTIYLLTIGKDPQVQKRGIEIGQLLKSEFSTLVNPFPWKIGRHFTYAEYVGAKIAIVIGAKDLANNVISVRNMATADQSTISIDGDLIQNLHDLLRQ